MENKIPNPQLQKSLSFGKTVIGIDIGFSSVNVVQTALYQGKPTVIKVAMENIVAQGDQEREKATGAALKKALADFDTQNADVICTVPNQKTIVDFVTMPLMPDAELSEAIKIEVSNSQRFSIENPLLDYQVAGHVLDKSVEKINVMVAVVAQSALDNLLSYFKPLQQNKYLGQLKKILLVQDFMGLNLVKVIPLSIALENVVKKIKSQVPETIVTLQMGSNSSELNIYRDGHLEFSRKINVTGLDFTRSLTSALSTAAGKVELSLQEAESVKKEFGIPSAGEEFLIKGKITANQAISLLRPKLEQLIKEIARSFDFYYDKNRAGKLDRLILLGGGTKLKRLSEFLNAELGMPVGSGDSWVKVDLLDEGLLNNFPDKHRLMVAIGASFAQAKGINLLPEALRDSKKKFFQKIIFGVSGICLVAVSALIYLLLQAHLVAIEQESQKIKSDFQMMTPEINDIKNKLLVQSISNHRLDMGGLLRELSYLPHEVTLTELNLNNGVLTLSGFVTEQARDSKKTLKSLVNELKKIALRDVKIMAINEDPGDKHKSSFTISANWPSRGSGG